MGVAPPPDQPEASPPSPGPPVDPGAGNCPRCGAPYEPYQEYCLECGLRLPLARGTIATLSTAWKQRLPWYPGDWIWPVLLLALIAVLGGLVAYLTTKDEGKTRTVITATGTGRTTTSPTETTGTETTGTETTGTETTGTETTGTETTGTETTGTGTAGGVR